jgi:RNA polymerase sigma factor (sigma-70 family)
MNAAAVGEDDPHRGEPAAACAEGAPSGRTERDLRWAALMRAGIAGDARAYRDLLREVAPVVRGIVRARGRGLEPETREDVVQEVLLALHAKRHTWRDTEPIQPWLYAIVRYKVADAFRARGCRVQVPVEDMADRLAAPLARDPTERSDAVRILARLEGRPAEVLQALALDGATISETAERLAMSPGSVRVALHRGLRKLATAGIGTAER